jgi:hypothetical protein
MIFLLLCFLIILIALEESNIAEDDHKYVEERIKRERQNITIYFLKSEFFNLLIISKIKKKLSSQNRELDALQYHLSPRNNTRFANRPAKK